MTQYTILILILESIFKLIVSWICKWKITYNFHLEKENDDIIYSFFYQRKMICYAVLEKLLVRNFRCSILTEVVQSLEGLIKEKKGSKRKSYEQNRYSMLLLKNTEKNFFSLKIWPIKCVAFSLHIKSVGILWVHHLSGQSRKIFVLIMFIIYLQSLINYSDVLIGCRFTVLIKVEWYLFIIKNILMKNKMHFDVEKIEKFESYKLEKNEFIAQEE